LNTYATKKMTIEKLAEIIYPGFGDVKQEIGGVKQDVAEVKQWVSKIETLLQT
jgi:hypothetical protein